MNKKNQQKRTAVDRRRFLLKSAGVASVLSVPTLSEASTWRAFKRFFRRARVPNIIPGLPPVLDPINLIDNVVKQLPDDLRYSGNPIHKNTLKAKDDPGFYELMKSVGIGGWSFCETLWKNSDDTNYKFGYMSFYYKDSSVNTSVDLPILGWYDGLSSDHRILTARYKFNFREVLNDSGVKDLESINCERVDIGPNINFHTSVRSELRRNLQQDPGWGFDWQIPDSWQSEFELWATSIDPVSRYPAFGVLVFQWGDRETYGIALRQIHVFQFQYTLVGGVWMRQAFVRRVMNLFGAYMEVDGTQVWRNFAMDQIAGYQVGPLNRVAQAFYLGAARQRILYGMSPALVPEEWPAIRYMPGFRVALRGWNAVLQRQQNQAALINAVLNQVRGGVGGAQLLIEMAGMGGAMLELGMDERNWPQNNGVVPLRFPVVRIDGQAVFDQQPVINGVQWNGGHRPVNFSPVNPINPALNNFWLDVPPGGENLPVPQGVQPYPQGAGAGAGAGAGIGNPPNVTAGNYFPYVNPPNVVEPNGVNLLLFAAQFVDNLQGTGDGGMDGVDAAIWTSIND